MGASQRRKGHNFERLIARMLRELGVDAWRGFQSRQDNPYQRVDKEPDVVCGPPLAHFWIECKVGAQPSVWRAMDQAVHDATPGRVPVVIAHRDRGRTLVCLELCDALEIVRGVVEGVS